MIISREFSKPNRCTFQVRAIKGLLQRYCLPDLVIVDPFARNNRFGTVTNDIDPNTAAQSHLDAVEFLHQLVEKSVKADVLLIDPPYSPRQMQECYARPGLGRLKFSNALLIGQVRKIAPDLVKVGGHVITFGWNSNGMGEPFRKKELLIVAHGSSHNDTICVVEHLVENKQAMLIAA